MEHSLSYPFRKACKNGHLETAKILLEIHNNYLNEKDIYKHMLIDFHIKNNSGFRKACRNGHLDVAMWLYSLDDKPNIHQENDFAFREACKNGHINVAQWLYSLDDKPNIHQENDFAFREACKGACDEKHINVAQWLLSLDDKPNFRINNDDVFRYLCSNHINTNIKIKFLQLLCTLCDDYSIVIKNNRIKSWKIKNGLIELLEKKEYDKIIEKLKIQRSDFLVDKEKLCSICYDNNYNFLTSCKHTFCIECFMMWYIEHDKPKCSYCQQNIDIELCSVKI
jgi:hypothetical protein